MLPTDVEGFDCVILSGGGTAGEVSDNEQLYINEIKIVRESGVPVFGICEGFQVVGAAYNSDFQILPFYRQGANKVRIIVDDPIFKDIEKIRNTCV